MATRPAGFPRHQLPDRASERVVPPVKAWALLGAAVLVLQVYVYGSWLTDGTARRTPVGDTPLPTWMKIVLSGWQIASPIAMAVFMYIVLVRPWRREGRITLDGLLCLVFGFTLFWQDPLGNYFQQVFTYNSLLSTRIPGPATS